MSDYIKIGGDLIAMDEIINIEDVVADVLVADELKVAPVRSMAWYLLGGPLAGLAELVGTAKTEPVTKRMHCLAFTFIDGSVLQVPYGISEDVSAKAARKILKDFNDRRHISP